MDQDKTYDMSFDDIQSAIFENLSKTHPAQLNTYEEDTDFVKPYVRPEPKQLFALCQEDLDSFKKIESRFKQLKAANGLLQQPKLTDSDIKNKLNAQNQRNISVTTNLATRVKEGCGDGNSARLDKCLKKSPRAEIYERYFSTKTTLRQASNKLEEEIDNYFETFHATEDWVNDVVNPSNETPTDDSKFLMEKLKTVAGKYSTRMPVQNDVHLANSENVHCDHPQKTPVPCNLLKSSTSSVAQAPTRQSRQSYVLQPHALDKVCRSYPKGSKVDADKGLWIERFRQHRRQQKEINIEANDCRQNPQNSAGDGARSESSNCFGNQMKQKSICNISELSSTLGPSVDDSTDIRFANSRYPLPDATRTTTYQLQVTCRGVKSEEAAVTTNSSVPENIRQTQLLFAFTAWLASLISSETRIEEEFHLSTLKVTGKYLAAVGDQLTSEPVAVYALLRADSQSGQDKTSLEGVEQRLESYCLAQMNEYLEKLPQAWTPPDRQWSSLLTQDTSLDLRVEMPDEEFWRQVVWLNTGDTEELCHVDNESSALKVERHTGGACEVRNDPVEVATIQIDLLSKCAETTFIMIYILLTELKGCAKLSVNFDWPNFNASKISFSALKNRTSSPCFTSVVSGPRAWAISSECCKLLRSLFNACAKSIRYSRTDFRDTSTEPSVSLQTHSANCIPSY